LCGDKVLGYDFNATDPEKKIVEVVVTNIDKHLTDSIFTMRTVDEGLIEASPQQLFFTLKPTLDQEGDAFKMDFVQAQDITKGYMFIDECFNCIPVAKTIKRTPKTTHSQKHSTKIINDHYCQVTTTETRIENIYVYAIEVEQPHTLLISDGSCNEETGKPRLLLTHNGIPALSVGASFVFGSTPASLSLAQVSAGVGGLGVAFGPVGVALGVATGLGILGYQFFKSKKKKKEHVSFYIEKANSGSPGGRDPKDDDDEDEKNRVREFEKKISKMPPGERVAVVREKAGKIAKERGWEKVERKILRSNGKRQIYRDKNTENLYSVDTQHGRFEVLNEDGVHLGEVDFAFNPTKGPDVSGGHNIRIP